MVFTLGEGIFLSKLGATITKENDDGHWQGDEVGEGQEP